MNNVWMSITVTKFYNAPVCDYGYLYIDTGCGYVTSMKLSYDEAQRQLNQLSKKLNKLPEMENNPHNPMIACKSLRGYIDRE